MARLYVGRTAAALVVNFIHSVAAGVDMCAREHALRDVIDSESCGNVARAAFCIPMLFKYSTGNLKKNVSKSN